MLSHSESQDFSFVGRNWQNDFQMYMKMQRTQTIQNNLKE